MFLKILHSAEVDMYNKYVSPITGIEAEDANSRFFQRSKGPTSFWRKSVCVVESKVT